MILIQFIHSDNAISPNSITKGLAPVSYHTPRSGLLHAIEPGHSILEDISLKPVWACKSFVTMVNREWTIIKVHKCRIYRFAIKY